MFVPVLAKAFMMFFLINIDIDETRVSDLYSYRTVSKVVIKGVQQFSKFCSLFRLGVLLLEVRFSARMDRLKIFKFQLLSYH